MSAEALREALAEALPDALRPVGAGLKNLPGTFRNQNTASERLTGYGAQVLDALMPTVAAAVEAAERSTSAEALGAVMAAISEWQSAEGAIDVAAYERDEFDADIRDAVMGGGGLERLRQVAAKFLTPEGDQITYRVTVTDV